MKQRFIPVNGAIFVEKYDKIKKMKDSSPFSALPTNDSLGVIKAVDASLEIDYPIGTKIFFKNKFERIFVNGFEMLVMEKDNIVAILNEEEGND